jgi:hypothetical protein
MSSAALEVKNSTIVGDRKDSGSDCPLDRYTWLQEQRKWHTDITVEAKVKFQVNNISYSRKDQDTYRPNEQLLNLSSSSSTNTDFFPLLKSIKAAPKLIPVIVKNELRINNRDNNIPSLKHKLSSTVKTKNISRTIKGLNEAERHKIMLIGDSHCRGMARNTSDYLGDKFEVMGMIKPGAEIKDIFASVTLNYRRLIKNDIIVVQGGTNDVYRNTRLALTQFVKFCEDLNNVNIIILDIRYRYDLMETSCVNKEIQVLIGN